MNKEFKILFFVVLLFWAQNSEAQNNSKSFWDSLFSIEKTSEEYVPEEDSIFDQARHRLLVLKDKAVEYYKKYTQEEPLVAEKKMEATRGISSEAEITSQNPNVSLYKTEGLEKRTKEFSDVKDHLKKSEMLSVKKGVEADSSLKKSKSGVAVFSFEKNSKINIKNIPALNIGVEDEVIAKNLTYELPAIFMLQFEKVKELSSPMLFKDKDLKEFYNMQYTKALDPVKFENISLSLPKEISIDKILAIQYVIKDTFQFQELMFTDITLDEISLLHAVILSEYRDKCHLSVGLLKNVQDIADSDRIQKEYHYATCMFKMGFFTEAIPLMQKLLVLNQKPYTTSTTSLLLADLKREYVKDIGESLEKVSVENVDPKSLNEFYYYLALSRSLNRDFKGAFSTAVKVDLKSDKYVEAQYLAAISEYMQGQISSSIDRQEKLLVEIDKRKTNVAVKTLVKMNLGRAAYRNKQYKKAIESYQFINKDSPLWIQALTEQGWMQVLAGDAPGAIGNMHSLQIPQFKDIYKPESYAVRAIGYLNICQYGDAQKTLQHLTKIYSPWIKTIKEELKKTQYNYVFYNNVLEALKGGDNKTTLPHPVIREVSRHKDFLNIQEAINNKVDEDHQYSFIKGLIIKDEINSKSKKQTSIGRTKDLDLKIKSSAKNPDLLKNITQIKTEREFESFTSAYYDFEAGLIKNSLSGFRNIEAVTRKAIADKKEDFKSLAGKTMKSRLLTMQKKLEKLMENNEFLAYEVFSGSGENIRYVASGGQVKGTSSSRVSASASSNGKLYLWDFDGEFWADEIGNYKSSLKDNCPKAGNLTQKVE